MSYRKRDLGLIIALLVITSFTMGSMLGVTHRANVNHDIMTNRVVPYVEAYKGGMTMENYTVTYAPLNTSDVTDVYIYQYRYSYGISYDWLNMFCIFSSNLGAEQIYWCDYSPEYGGLYWFVWFIGFDGTLMVVQGTI